MSVSGTGPRIFASLELAGRFPSTVWSIIGGWVLEGRGVVTASPVKDLTEAEETGREVVSGASSNESCSRSELSALDILVSFSAIVVLSILIQGSVVKLRQDSNLHHQIPPLLLPLPQAKCPNLNHHICRDHPGRDWIRDALATVTDLDGLHNPSHCCHFRLQHAGTLARLDDVMSRHGHHLQSVSSSHTDYSCQSVYETSSIKKDPSATQFLNIEGSLRALRIFRLSFVPPLPLPSHRGSDQKLPRAACSRSTASKRALKLPAPNPSKLWRWMISMKTVGRSSTGLVKICSR